MGASLLFLSHRIHLCGLPYVLASYKVAVRWPEGSLRRSLHSMGTLPQFDSRSQFMRQVPAGAKLLDLGCGRFKTLKRLREQRPDLDYYGVGILDVFSDCPARVVF